MNLLVNITIIGSAVLLIVLAKLAYKIRFSKDTPQEKSTKKQYGFIPKTGKISHIVLFILLMILISAASCSPRATLKCGSKYRLIAPKFKA